MQIVRDVCWGDELYRVLWDGAELTVCGTLERAVAECEDRLGGPVRIEMMEDERVWRVVLIMAWRERCAQLEAVLCRQATEEE